MLPRKRQNALDAHPRLPGLWARLSLLTWRERAFALLLLLCAFLPPALSFGARLADLAGHAPPGFLAAHPALLSLLGALAALLVCLAFEPPRSRDASAWASQLRARLRQAQSTYDAGLQRLAEEQHRHVQHPPRHHP